MENKTRKFTYIYNGKIHNTELELKGLLEGIPIYISENKGELNLLKTDSGEYMFIVCGDIEYSDLDLWHILYRIYFRDNGVVNTCIMADICCAYKFGFNAMMDKIEVSGKNIKQRIDKLEDVLRYEKRKGKISIPSDKEVLQLFKSDTNINIGEHG